MLLVSQRDVDKYGSQPVGITLYFYVVGFRVNPGLVVQDTIYIRPWWHRILYQALEQRWAKLL